MLPEGSLGMVARWRSFFYDETKIQNRRRFYLSTLYIVTHKIFILMEATFTKNHHLQLHWATILSWMRLSLKSTSF